MRWAIPAGFHLTPGQAHDFKGADILLKGAQAGGIIAAKACDAQARVIEPLLQAGKAVVIPPKAARRPPAQLLNRHLCKARHLIENFFARLKQYRAHCHAPSQNRAQLPGRHPSGWRCRLAQLMKRPGTRTVGINKL